MAIVFDENGKYVDEKGLVKIGRASCRERV